MVFKKWRLFLFFRNFLFISFLKAMSNTISEGYIKEYYNKFFPLDAIKEWIQYGGKEPLDRRECAYWFDSQRFNRWASINDMRRILDNLTLSPPERMEIGPVYTYPLKERNSVQLGTFYAVHRELVFDIDSDDFKDIKDCCGDSEICRRCWRYMCCALECLIKALTENFGFKYILPVYSGRRGVHIWVCDDKARELSQKVREGIVNYLNINEIVNSPNFQHITDCPFAQQMLQTCERYFIQIAEEYSIFTNPKLVDKVKGVVGEEVYNKIMTRFTEYGNQSFEAQWNAIKEKPLIQGAKKRFDETLSYYRLIFHFSFPRLDANVTITMNHLLKSPFSYHPKSGLLSLPIPLDKFDQFPPSWVPKLVDLIDNNPDARNAYDNALKQFEEFKDSVINS